jgi:hypothetical protein
MVAKLQDRKLELVSLQALRKRVLGLARGI